MKNLNLTYQGSRNDWVHFEDSAEGSQKYDQGTLASHHTHQEQSHSGASPAKVGIESDHCDDVSHSN